MHATQTLLGQIAALFAIVQVVPYVRSILKGKTRPSRTSYGIWAVVDTIGAIGYVNAGATTTAWVMIVLAINAIGIYALSLKYGMRGHTKVDVPCLIIAGLAVAVWLATNNPALAVYMSALAGFLGYLPTIRKSYLWPHSESTLSWSMYAVAAALNMCALTQLSPAIILLPFLSLCMAFTVAGLLVFPRWKFRGRRRFRSAIPAHL